MIIVPDITMRTLMHQIVEATHSLADEQGNPRTMSTISASQLRMAAIVALQVATGEAIWPGDKTIFIKRPKVHQGIFQEE